MKSTYWTKSVPSSSLLAPFRKEIFAKNTIWDIYKFVETTKIWGKKKLELLFRFTMPYKSALPNFELFDN